MLEIKPVIVEVSVFIASNIHAQNMSVITINDSGYIVSGGVNELSVSRIFIVAVRVNIASTN
ncbi:MAG: hypothetical protein ACJAS9_003137 [Polaribacter sp.]|jgi:uncharacterized protein YunC (DUF1805 family)